MTLDDQLLLDLGGAPSLTRDDLVVSPSNISAVSLVDGWPDWHAPYAILVGLEGCGKSHLAEVWRARSSAHLADETNLAASLEQAQKSTPILIDGLAPDGLDETALFHLMNAVRTAQSTMLITAESAPEHWPIKTPDLLSRIKAATAVLIDEPDDALMQAVIIKLFTDRQINIDPAIADYLTLRIERSLAAANNIVATIDRAALVNKARITKPFVNQVLKTIEAEGQPSLPF